MPESEIKKFYSEINFPGPYTIDDLCYYDTDMCNKFLSKYNDKVIGNERILDLGCGSGFITNLIAKRHPGVAIDAIDFSNSIDYAENFSRTHNITNIHYIKENFLDWQPTGYYDYIMSNGVLHHIGQHRQAFEKVNSLLKINGLAVIGIYNSYGKIAKSMFNIKYRRHLLYLDQETAPYETSFSHKEFLSYFKNYKLENVHPGVCNHLVDFRNIFNYHNGGLTVYQLRKYHA
jgi:2-polyprenyl-3-methyl-5-hydroxy-6-metoxy-1,4-benzoquinol methylase